CNVLQPENFILIPPTIHDRSTERNPEKIILPQRVLISLAYGPKTRSVTYTRPETSTAGEISGMGHSTPITIPRARDCNHSDLSPAQGSFAHPTEGSSFDRFRLRFDSSSSACRPNACGAGPRLCLPNRPVHWQISRLARPW